MGVLGKKLVKVISYSLSFKTSIRAKIYKKNTKKQQKSGIKNITKTIPLKTRLFIIVGIWVVTKS